MPHGPKLTITSKQQQQHGSEPLITCGQLVKLLEIPDDAASKERLHVSASPPESTKATASKPTALPKSPNSSASSAETAPRSSPSQPPSPAIPTRCRTHLAFTSSCSTGSRKKRAACRCPSSGTTICTRMMSRMAANRSSSSAA